MRVRVFTHLCFGRGHFGGVLGRAWIGRGSGRSGENYDRWIVMEIFRLGVACELAGGVVLFGVQTCEYTHEVWFSV